MSWVSRMVEQRLANAAEAGELDGGSLKGKPLPGIDTQRPDGWWAEQFVKRELSHDRRKAALEAAAVARTEFWKAASLGELRDQVITANEAIAKVNINLTDADQIERFDIADVRRRWSRLRPAT
jgi:DnaJ homologue, subfamily C, member 28, conserved domain